MIASSPIHTNFFFFFFTIVFKCYLTQSTAPGRVISVAKKTISSPCKVVIDLWASQRCCMTLSRLPCHLHDAPGHGHTYWESQRKTFRTKKRSNIHYLLDGNHRILHVRVYAYALDLSYIHWIDIYMETKSYQQLFPCPNYGYCLDRKKNSISDQIFFEIQSVAYLTVHDTSDKMIVFVYIVNRQYDLIGIEESVVKRNQNKQDIRTN